MSCFLLSAFADEIADDLKIQMETLGQHGIGYMEIRSVNGKSIVNHSLQEVADIKKKLDKMHLKISAIGSPIGKINITDDFGPHMELFKHTVKIAQILETKYIRMFSFYIPKGKKPEMYRDEVINRWREFIKEADGSGLILLHENEKDIYGDTPERCLDLFETLNCSFVKAVFDPANFVQCDVETYPKAFQLLKNHIVYMHIKDALYKDHSVVPAGHGEGYISKILVSLRDDGYKGFLSLEPHLAAFTALTELERDSTVGKLPEGGPRTFAIAANALKKILSEISGE